MSETRRGRIEQVILSSLADIYHGHENIPYTEQAAAARLSLMIDEGSNPWGLRDRGGVIELDGGKWAEVDFMLTADTCREIENHPDIDLKTEADQS